MLVRFHSNSMIGCWPATHWTAMARTPVGVVGGGLDQDLAIPDYDSVERAADVRRADGSGVGPSVERRGAGR